MISSSLTSRLRRTTETGVIRFLRTIGCFWLAGKLAPTGVLRLVGEPSSSSYDYKKLFEAADSLLHTMRNTSAAGWCALELTCAQWRYLILRSPHTSLEKTEQIRLLLTLLQDVRA